MRLLDARLADARSSGSGARARGRARSAAVLLEGGRADAAQLAARRAPASAGSTRPSCRRASRPAPTMVWISSMKRIGAGLLLERAEDGLEALLELAAELGAGEQRAHVERVDRRASRRPRGHLALRWMRSARPSTIAVLPTPGSPTKSGLFLRRRQRTWIVRSSSRSRPMSGSILPGGGALDQVDREAGERDRARRGRPRRRPSPSPASAAGSGARGHLGDAVRDVA